MDWKQVIFLTFGGLGLFLMGMKIMSDGLQKAAGDKLRKTLNFLTTNRFMGVGIGFLITAVIQSSSATTVMVVGFVNATLMNLTQAIGVILGANIGTTVTGWIVTLNFVKYAMPVIGLGVMIRFFSKSENWRYTGEIIFGLGLLFLGMETMSAGFAPLKHSAGFISFFTKVDGSGFGSVLLGVAVGLIATLIVQSSSATTGITIALAAQGLISYEGAVALILGENIGTTITAILASLGGNFHAKRAALAHTLFNVMGCCIMISLFYPFVNIVDNAVPGSPNFKIETVEQAVHYGITNPEKAEAAIGSRPYIGKHIAMAHTLFNVINVILFLPFISYLAKLCTKIIKEPKNVEMPRVLDFTHLDLRMIETPAIGIMETEKKLISMAEQVAKSALVVQDIINSKLPQKALCDDVLSTEKAIDEYQKYITEFLVNLSASALSEKDAHHIGSYMTLSHNLEKYADHLEHITLIFDKIYRQNLILSDEAREWVNKIFVENNNFFSASFNAISEEIDSQAFIDNARVLNRRIKKLITEAKMEHFERLRKKVCENDAALQYVDILNYLDGMRAQAYNIAEITTGTKYQQM